MASSLTDDALSVFISYRREDTGGHAGRLHDSLRHELGDAQLFRLSTEGRSWLKRILAEPDLPVLLRAGAATTTGFLAYIQGDLPAAEPHLEEGPGLYGAAEAGAGAGAEGRLFALCYLGATHLEGGRPGRAEALADEALALARSQDDVELLRFALDFSAYVARWRGDTCRAAPLLEECLALARRQGDELVAAQLLGSLAQVAADEERFDDAAATAFEVIELATRLHDQVASHDALVALGLVAISVGRSEEAIVRYQDALRRPELARTPSGCHPTLRGGQGAAGRARRAEQPLRAAVRALPPRRP